MELKGRLKEISKFVDKGSNILDLGCDHAYLSIYLVEKGIASKALASDNKDEPLLSAKANILKSSLSDKITTIKSNGLDNIDPNLYDTLIIAGLGGELIREILKSPKLNKDATLILEGNNSEKDIREFLDSNNYLITDEELIEDKGHYYQIIKAKRMNDDFKMNLDSLELTFGPIILKNKTQIFKDYINRNIVVLENKLTGINDTVLINKINYFKGALDYESKRYN